MFRFTWDGPAALRKSMRPDKKPQRLRVYRWENKWGVLCAETGAWWAEARVPVAHSQRDDTRFLLETVESLEDEAPPLSIDDAWEEDAVPLSDGSYAGVSMSLRGTAAELTAWCERTGLLLPPAIASFLAARNLEMNNFGSVLSK